MQQGYTNNKVLNTTRYALIHGEYWVVSCIIYAYASVYLLAHGFTNTQIGIIIACASVGAALLQPIVGDILDKYKQITLQKVMILLSMIILAIVIILCIMPVPQLMLGILYVMMIGVLQIIIPLINAIGMHYINRNISINFGVARSAGSICYAITSSVIGQLVARYNESLLPALMAITTVVFILVVYIFRFKQVEQIEEVNDDNNVINTDERQSFYKQYPKFMLLVVALIFTFTSHNMLCNFLFQIVQSHGAGSEAMGIAGTVCAISEIPTMCLFSLFIKKISVDKLLKVSGIFFALKALGTFLAPNLTIMYIAQTAQMLGFAMFAVASVYYVNERIIEKDRVKGQAYVTMTMSIGTVIGCLFGGMIIDQISVWAMLLVATILGCIGAIGIFLFTEKLHTKY